MAETKQAYISPPEGVLEISIIRDANPRVLINLDLGIPNFTVFSMNLPLVEDQPNAMSGLIAEAVHVLLDEVSNFMISTEYEKEVIVQMYATVLATFKNMSNEADSSKEQDVIGADPVVKTLEGTFQLPMSFVNETYKKVVTAASLGLNRAEALYKRIAKFKLDPQRQQLLKAAQTMDTSGAQEAAGQALSDYQHKIINELFGLLAEYFASDDMFPEENAVEDLGKDKYEYAGQNLSMAQHAREKKMYSFAATCEEIALDNISTAVSYVRNELRHREQLAESKTLVDEIMNVLSSKSGATKVQRSPKVRHIELTYSPKQKNTVDDTARVIRQYRNRSLRQQPNPMFVVVYDRQGKPRGTISLGPGFKNDLLKAMKKGSVDFSPPISFSTEESMKGTAIKGIPKTISVTGDTYLAVATAGPDMALYHGPSDWLVKFTDGRSQIFPGRPTFANMRRLNFPVPRNRHKWTMIPQDEAPKEEKPAAASIEPVEASSADTGGTLQ